MSEIGRKTIPHLVTQSDLSSPVIIYLTVCTQGRRPILANSIAHDLIRSAWEQSSRWQVGRYVIMPDHLHLFVAPTNDQAGSLSVWISFWKSLVTRDWPISTDKPLWQKSYWDRQLRREESYAEKWDYVRQNPVRHGLVKSAEDWPSQGEVNPLAWY